MITKEIIKASKELSTKQQLQINDTSNLIKLDTATNNNNNIILDVDMWCIVKVTKEDGDNFNTYNIIDKNGSVYTTTSTIFWDKFNRYYTELSQTDEEWKIEVFKTPSKKHPGKSYLTCKVV